MSGNAAVAILCFVACGAFVTAGGTIDCSALGPVKARFLVSRRTPMQWKAQVCLFIGSLSISMAIAFVNRATGGLEWAWPGIAACLLLSVMPAAVHNHRVSRAD